MISDRTKQAAGGESARRQAWQPAQAKRWLTPQPPATGVAIDSRSMAGQSSRAVAKARPSMALSRLAAANGPHRLALSMKVRLGLKG